MLSYEEINHILNKRLPLQHYKHTHGVVKSAIELSKRYHSDIDKAKLAALLHDNAKHLEEDELIKLADKQKIAIDEIMTKELALLHAPAGCLIAQRDFGVEDKEILGAIRYHTTGRANMSLLEKIIYLADYIEEGRNYSEVQRIREASKDNLDKALLLALDNSIKYIIKRCKLIHPFTIEARNDILGKMYYNREKL